MRRTLTLFGSRRDWRSVIASALLIVPVAAMAGAAPALAVDKTWVQFSPRPNVVPPGGFRMEIDGHAYLVTANHSGVTTLDLSTPTDVVIRRQSDCKILPGGRFTLTPGTVTGVDINADGSVRLTDYTGSDIDAGPGLDPGAPPCGSLPPTDAIGPVPAQATCIDHAIRSTEAVRGVAFVGRVTNVRRAPSSVDAEYTINLYEFEVLRGLRHSTRGGTVAIETPTSCPGVVFPKVGWLLVSTGARIEALQRNTVVWRIHEDSLVELVVPTSRAGVTPEILGAPTLNEAIDLVAPGLPPTDVANDLVMPSGLSSGGPPLLILGSAIGIALLFHRRRLQVAH